MVRCYAFLRWHVVTNFGNGTEWRPEARASRSSWKGKFVEPWASNKVKETSFDDNFGWNLDEVWQRLDGEAHGWNSCTTWDGSTTNLTGLLVVLPAQLSMMPRYSPVGLQHHWPVLWAAFRSRRLGRRGKSWNVSHLARGIGGLNEAFLSNTGSEESLNKAFYFGWDAFEGRWGIDPERVLKREWGSKNQSHSECLPHAIPFSWGKDWGGVVP